MGTATILVVVIASPLIFGAAVLFCASEIWLRSFAELARALGRMM